MRNGIVAGRSTRSLEVTRTIVQISRMTAGWFNFVAMVGVASLFLVGVAFRGNLDSAWPWVAAIGAITVGAVHVWAARIIEAENVVSKSTRRGLITVGLTGGVLVTVGAIGTWMR